MCKDVIFNAPPLRKLTINNRFFRSYISGRISGRFVNFDDHGIMTTCIDWDSKFVCRRDASARRFGALTIDDHLPRRTIQQRSST